MSIIQKGRVCIKTAGKERNKPCVIIDVIDDKYVLIDGLVKRRKCNINHLKFLDKVIKIDEKTNKEKIIKALVDEGIISKEKFEKIKKLEERKKKKNGKKEK
ncbi:MAG: 50S ribosomal protein L14e [Candidatus Pacearchaeota archaeon]